MRTSLREYPHHHLNPDRHAPPSPTELRTLRHPVKTGQQCPSCLCLGSGSETLGCQLGGSRKHRGMNPLLELQEELGFRQRPYSGVHPSRASWALPSQGTHTDWQAKTQMRAGNKAHHLCPGKCLQMGLPWERGEWAGMWLHRCRTSSPYLWLCLEGPASGGDSIW